MPLLLEETEVRVEFADLYKRCPVSHPVVNSVITPPERAKGIHLSGVLKYCAVISKFLKPGEPLEEEMPWRMAMGMAVEEFLVSLYPEIIWQPGERECDGVYMNADGLSTLTYGPLNDETLIEEFKCTWKRRRDQKEILREFLWQHQMRAECYAFVANFARLHVMYVNGDYRPSQPMYIRYLFQYTDEELEQTWSMIQKNKHKAVPE